MRSQARDNGTRVTPPIQFSKKKLLELSSEIVMGLEVFLWLWIMEDEISEHSSNFCWVCFVGKIPASNILYNGFKRMKEEQGLLIQQKKVQMQQGLNP